VSSTLGIERLDCVIFCSRPSSTPKTSEDRVAHLPLSTNLLVSASTFVDLKPISRRFYRFAFPVASGRAHQSSAQRRTHHKVSSLWCDFCGFQSTHFNQHCFLFFEFIFVLTNTAPGSKVLVIPHPSHNPQPNLGLPNKFGKFFYTFFLFNEQIKLFQLICLFQWLCQLPYRIR
jgi:hypothetical protein